MGMDLLIAALATTSPAALDWDAGRNAIDTVDMDVLLERWPDAPYHLPGAPDSYDDGELHDALRRFLRQQVDALQAAWTDGGRDQSTLMFGPWTIWLSGGASWGDSPSDTFDAVHALSYAPEVEQAIGFSWPAHQSL